MRFYIVPAVLMIILASCDGSAPDTFDGGTDAPARNRSASDAEADAAPADAGPVDGSPSPPIVDRPPPCTGTVLECCGGSPCPTGTTECTNDRCYATVAIAARVDGLDNLLLKGNTARWQHVQFEAPTGLKLDGEDWNATFPANNLPDDKCNLCFSSTSKTLKAPVAAHDQAGTVVASTGRGTVKIAPATKENGYELAIQFTDSPNSADDYTATVKYETR